MKKYQTNYNNLAGESVQGTGDSTSKYRKYRKEWKENPLNGIVNAFPLNVDIEVTNACNLQCPHCARTKKSWGDSKVGFMNKNAAKKIIDEAKREGAYCVKFSLRGEPLLHQKLPLFLKWCKDSNLVDYYFNTNGVLLSKEISQNLVDMQIPRISLSVGGWDAESYSRCQVGASLELVRDNILTLKNIREEMCMPYPKIRVQAVLTDELKPHLEELRIMWSGIADEIGLIDFREETGNQTPRGLVDSDFRCNYLWQRLVVLWDGTVLPCLFHGVSDIRSITLGNIGGNTSLKEMWNGKKLNALRKLHTAGLSHKNECCDNCSYRFAEISKSVKLKG